LLAELSIDQHHDAIAGTAMQYVTNDYQFRLSVAQDKGLIQTKKYLSEVLAQHGIQTKNGAESVLRC
jgi:hypothetical protein